MSFVERFIILCPYLGESTIRAFTIVLSNRTFSIHDVGTILIHATHNNVDDLFFVISMSYSKLFLLFSFCNLCAVCV